MAMEVIGGRVNSIEGKRNPGKPIAGFDISMGIEDVRVGDEKVEVDYIYVASYRGDLGNINIKGTVFVKDGTEQLKKLKEDWEKSKKLPVEYANLLAGLIPRVGTVHGIMIGKVLDLPAPLPPFRVGKPKVQAKK